MDVHKVKPLLPENSFKRLQRICRSSYKNFPYSEEFGRYFINDKEFKPLASYLEHLVPLARDVFNTETLVPSYAIFAHYEGNQASLAKHKDNNACTYTIDLCLYQITPWGLWVEGREYMLDENEALAFYGEDQEHWREEFPNPVTNQVGQVFFHFVEPDHWFFDENN